MLGGPGPHPHPLPARPGLPSPEPLPPRGGGGGGGGLENGPERPSPLHLPDGRVVVSDSLGTARTHRV